MTVTVYVPSDTTACALGADEVAAEIAAQAQVRRLDIEIVRNGSRGAFWLDPLVEVDTGDGRQAYGPIVAEDVASLFNAGFPGTCEHSSSLGSTDEIPWLARQQRLTLRRAGLADPLSLVAYLANNGYRGLGRAFTF